MDIIEQYKELIYSMPSIFTFKSVLFFVGFFVLSLLFRKFKISLIGSMGEKKVYNKLRFLEGRGYVILNDIYLPLYDKTTQIDHVVIGPSGITIIETKGHSGQIRGSQDHRMWTQYIGRYVYDLYNPLLQNTTHINAVKYLLRKEGFNLDISNLVVFTSSNCRIITEENLPVIPLKLLKKWFIADSEMFDSCIDVETVKNAILKYQITDHDIKRRHKNFVKKQAQMTS